MGAAAVERGSPQAQPPHLSIPVYEPGGTAAAVVAAANGDGRRNSSSGSSSNQHHAHAHTQDGPTDQASKAPSPPASAAGPAEEQEQQPPPSSSAARRRASKPHQQSPPQQQQQRPRRQCAGSGRLCPSPAALRRARRPLLLALGVTALLLVGSFLAARYKKNLLSAAEWIRGQAPWSAVYYSVIIFVWIFLCLPSSLVEMVAGMIYSYPTALATVVVGKQLACNLSFVLGRRFLSTSVLMRGEGLLLARLGEEGKEEEAEAEAAVAAAAVAAAEGTASHSSSEEEDGEGGSEGLSRGSSPLRSVEGGGGGDGGVEMVEVIGGEGAVGVEEEQPPPRPPRPPHSNATMQALFLAVENHPWQVVVLLRLLPVPIGAKNYGMAALPVPFYVYCVGTFFAEIPGTVVSTYLGASCRSLLEAINGGPRGGRDQRRRHQELAFLIVGLCVLLLLVALLGRYTRHYRAKLLAEAEVQHRQSLSPAPSLVADAAAVAGGGRDKEEEERMNISAPLPAAVAARAAAEGEDLAV